MHGVQITQGLLNAVGRAERLAAVPLLQHSKLLMRQSLCGSHRWVRGGEG